MCQAFRPFTGTIWDLGHWKTVDKDNGNRVLKRNEMAADREIKTEFKAHESSYSGFTKMMKWGTIFSLISAAIVVLIISN